MRNALLFVFLAAAGCATGFDRGSLARELDDVPQQVSDADIEHNLSLRPMAKLPLRLGIYLSPYAGPGGGMWTEADKQKLLSLREDVKRSGLAADVFFISGLTVEPGATATELKRIRLAAARHGADAVLVVKAAVQVDDYVNPLSLLYLTIVGLWVVPGTHYDALFLVRGGLWDVRNEYLYMTAEAEGIGKRVGTPLWVRSRGAVDEARESPIKDFQEELRKRMNTLASDPRIPLESPRIR